MSQREREWKNNVVVEWGPVSYTHLPHNTVSNLYKVCSFLSFCLTFTLINTKSGYKKKAAGPCHFALNVFHCNLKTINHIKQIDFKATI